MVLFNIVNNFQAFICIAIELLFTKSSFHLFDCLWGQFKFNNFFEMTEYMTVDSINSSGLCGENKVFLAAFFPVFCWNLWQWIICPPKSYCDKLKKMTACGFGAKQRKYYKRNLVKLNDFGILFPLPVS